MALPVVYEIDGVTWRRKRFKPGGVGGIKICAACKFGYILPGHYYYQTDVPFSAEWVVPVSICVQCSEQGETDGKEK